MHLTASRCARARRRPAVLIFAGGLVTSTGSGLSVPDWPNTYGWFMFSFPLEKMVGGIRYEHTHRLIASTVGFLILVLAVWLWRAEPRRWVRRLGYVALAAVITQGVLGGITVLWYLPDADLDCARQPGADRLLPDGGDRAGHVAGWKRAYAPTRTRARRPHPADGRRRHDGRDLRCRSSSARRCGTPTRGWRFPTSRSRSAI